MARSAEHEVQVELNHNGAGFLCTLRQKFQFNGIRMGSGRCVFSLPLTFEVVFLQRQRFNCKASRHYRARTGNTILILYSRTFINYWVSDFFYYFPRDKAHCLESVFWVWFQQPASCLVCNTDIGKYRTGLSV